MPHDFVKMHRSFGHESRLLTMYRNTLNFEEDICLGLKLQTGSFAHKWRNKKVDMNSGGGLKFAGPGNSAEKLFFEFRDMKNSAVIEKAVKEYGLLDFDIYHFDGGMDLYRDVRFARRLKDMGKKIVCCYFGSDLRSRGIFSELDSISDLNLTVEYDHLDLYKGINYIFFPFETSGYEIRERSNSAVKIIHSPTNRRFKGTDKILNVIDEVKKIRNIEFILLENMDRHEVLKVKSTCDLAIDQVGGEMGGSGYGRNSIENLAMGVPTFTEFAPDYFRFIGENPFINSTIGSLKEDLLRLIDDKRERNRLAEFGREWVEENHSYRAVNRKLAGYYEKSNIEADE